MTITRFLLLLLSLAATAIAAEPAQNLITNPALRPGSNQLPEGWTTWSPRAQLAPKSEAVTSRRERGFMRCGGVTRERGKRRAVHIGTKAP